MTSRIWSEEMVRVTTKSLDTAKDNVKDIRDPIVRLCLEELTYVVEVLVNQEVRRSKEA